MFAWKSEVVEAAAAEDTDIQSAAGVDIEAPEAVASVEVEEVAVLCLAEAAMAKRRGRKALIHLRPRRD